MEISNFSLRKFAMAVWLAAPLSVAADPACQPIFNAMTKLLAAPVHIYSTETAAYAAKGKAHEGEVIYAGGAVYLRINGAWRRSPMTLQRVKAQQVENQQNAKGTCRFVRDEPVNGEAASVYTMHQNTEDSTEDGQIWISKSRTLPLRDEIDMDVGGKDGKSHRSVRYEYSNVQAPAAAR